MGAIEDGSVEEVVSTHSEEEIRRRINRYQRHLIKANDKWIEWSIHIDNWSHASNHHHFGFVCVDRDKEKVLLKPTFRY